MFEISDLITRLVRFLVTFSVIFLCNFSHPKLVINIEIIFVFNTVTYNKLNATKTDSFTLNGRQ